MNRLKQFYDPIKQYYFDKKQFKSFLCCLKRLKVKIPNFIILKIIDSIGKVVNNKIIMFKLTPNIADIFNQKKNTFEKYFNMNIEFLKENIKTVSYLDITNTHITNVTIKTYYKNNIGDKKIKIYFDDFYKLIRPYKYVDNVYLVIDSLNVCHVWYKNEISEKYDFDFIDTIYTGLFCYENNFHSDGVIVADSINYSFTYYNISLESIYDFMLMARYYFCIEIRFYENKLCLMMAYGNKIDITPISINGPKLDYIKNHLYELKHFMFIFQKIKKIPKNTTMISIGIINEKDKNKCNIDGLLNIKVELDDICYNNFVTDLK